MVIAEQVSIRRRYFVFRDLPGKKVKITLNLMNERRAGSTQFLDPRGEVLIAHQSGDPGEVR